MKKSLESFRSELIGNCLTIEESTNVKGGGFWGTVWKYTKKGFWAAAEHGVTYKGKF